MEAADSDIVASIEDRRDVLVTLAAEVALNYIGLRGLQREIVIAKDNLAAQEHTLDLTRRLFGGGFKSWELEKLTAQRLEGLLKKAGLSMDSDAREEFMYHTSATTNDARARCE